MIFEDRPDVVGKPLRRALFTGESFQAVPDFLRHSDRDDLFRSPFFFTHHVYVLSYRIRFVK